jgi:TolA-binding protein
MMGMSQLKLGKRDEAKATLLRSTGLRKNLYDAHFRLSLLEYQDNNIKEANKHFKKLRKIGSKCKKCEAKKEIAAQIKYLENLLA